MNDSLRFASAQDIARVCEWRALVEHLRRSHCEVPALTDRMLLQHADRALLVLPAWAPAQALGVKLATSFPGNADAPAVQALYVLFDGRDGSPQLLLDGTELTYWKTAADGALGADLLARPHAATLLMVGAGALAPYRVRAHCAGGRPSRVCCCGTARRPGATRWPCNSARATTCRAHGACGTSSRPSPRPTSSVAPPARANHCSAVRAA